MPQTQTMTLDEKLAISNKAAALWNVGDKEGSSRLTRYSYRFIKRNKF